MRKVLRLEAVSITGAGVEFRVAEQSHRGVEFGDKGHRFSASNNMFFESHAYPEIMFPVVFVMGKDTKSDDDVLYCSVDMWKRIQEAAREYNEHEFEDIEESPKVTETQPVESDARLKVISFIMATLSVSEFAGYDEMAIEAIKRSDAVMKRLEKKQ